MKKMKLPVMLFVALILCLLLTMQARAADVAASQEEALELGKLEDALPESAEDALNGLSVMDSLDLESGLDAIIESVSGGADGLFKTGLRSAVIILIIAVFCSVVSAIYGETGPNYVILAGILAISAVAVSDVHSFIGLGKTTLDDLNTFSKMLLPTLTAAAAASGAFTSAAAKYAATALFMDLLMTISSTVVMPLIYAYTAASIAGAAIGGEGLQGAASFLKWLTTWILTAMMIAFTAYLTLTGVIAGTTDAAASRLAKTTISTLLPVVGGIISDAADTVVAGAAVLRNAVGIFGMLTVVAICLVPFIRLGVHYLFYKIAAGLTGGVADSRISKLVGAIGTSFGMTLGLVGACAIMLFFSIISVIQVVNPS